MITYVKFKKIYDNIGSYKELEIEFYFKNRKNSYMIIRYNDYITFQRCGTEEEGSGEIKFKSLDVLYNSQTIDNIVLKDEWDNIEDILFNGFSVIADKEEILNLYGVKI